MGALVRRRAPGFGEVVEGGTVVVQPAPPAPKEPGNLIDSGGKLLYSIAGTLAAGACAYHGYKRNRGSVGWAVGWFFFGGMIPVLAVPIAIGQGFGDPARK